MPSGVFCKLKIGFSVLAPNSNFAEFRTKFRENPPIISGLGRISNSDLAYLMLQTFLYNLQKPVCRYLVTRLEPRLYTKSPLFWFSKKKLPEVTVYTQVGPDRFGCKSTKIEKKIDENSQSFILVRILALCMTKS